jgi:hypothetical protein
VAHGISYDPKDVGSGDQDMQRQVIQTAVSTIQAQFPNTVLIPTIGNNDYYVHNQAPAESDKNEYYSFLYSTFFAGSRGSQDIENTFLNGGYYRLDLSENLSVLALNTMYYSIKNDKSNQATEPFDQLEWLSN